MEISIFFARFWGSLFIILGLMAISSGFLKKTIKRSEDKYFTIYTGYVTLLLGLVTIILHNIWSLDWRLIITLLGWTTFLKGVLKTCFPEHVHKKALMFKKANIFWAFIILLFGLFLFWLSLI